jgi:uncharacterized protein DUF4019
MVAAAPSDHLFTSMTEHDPAAERAALEWLALIDRGETGASWDAAASLFRRAVPAQQWAQSLDVARTPLGAVVARRLKSARAAKELPGAPDGEYVVLQFDTTFEHKRAAVETVTPTRDVDGQWHVSGYFVR